MSSQPTVQKFKIANPPIDGNPRTYLSADIASGVGATGGIPVLSTSGFTLGGTSDYYILIGDYGEEKSEIVLVDASDAGTDANSFTTSATQFSHSSGDPVTFIEYNKFRIYGRVVTGGTGTLVATNNVDCSKQYSDYIYDGGSYSYFYTCYYNANDDEESAYSDEISSNTFTQTSAKKVIESAVRKAMTNIDQSSGSPLDWEVATDVLNDGLDEIMSKKRKWPFLHKISSGTSTTGGTAYITKPTDLAVLEHLIIDNYKLDHMSRYKYDEYDKGGAPVSTGTPTHFTVKNNKFYLYPTPSGSFAVIYEYYQYPDRITELSDSINREFIPILIYYCASQFAYIRGNDKRGDKMYTFYTKLVEELSIEYSGPEQLGDSETSEQVNDNYYESEFLN